MHTLVAFYNSNVAANASYTQIAAVLDQAMPQDGASRFLPPTDYDVLAAYGLGLHLTAMRINTPSLRSMFLPEIVPVTVASAPAATDTPVFYGDRAVRVMKNEGLEIDASADATGGTPVWAGLWLTPQFVPAPGGRVFTAVATATITAVAGQWVLGTLTFTQNLPVGTYAIVGAYVNAANTALARFVFTGNNNFRPGVLVSTTYGQKPLDDYFRRGRAGLFGTFTNTTLPQLEIFGDAAGAAAPTVYLDLVKVG